MPLQDAVQDLNLEAPIDLFTLSGLNIPTLNFCNVGRVVFGGITYLPIPCKTEWLPKNSEGTEQTLTLVVSDVEAHVGTILDNYTGIRGADIRVKRTWSLFLDGQPGADPTQFSEIEMRVNTYDGVYADQFEFALIPSVTLERIETPRRSYLRRCQFQLSDSRCQAPTNIHFDLAGNPTTPENRACGKGGDNCFQYFGHQKRHGGFPATQRRR